MQFSVAQEVCVCATFIGFGIINHQVLNKKPVRDLESGIDFQNPTLRTVYVVNCICGETVYVLLAKTCVGRTETSGISY
jgi:hypothetical protein